MPDFKKQYDEYLRVIEEAIEEYLPSADCPQKSVVEAMRYSMGAGGKRIRPVLLLEFMRVCGGDYHDALPFAAALEMIHTYSLIHDDLPCMDNDDLRRGKPSCHKAFGETAALLAGDGLLTCAFETALGRTDFMKISCEAALKALRILAEAAGVSGMIGGQVLDLESENQAIEGAFLTRIYALKTGTLLSAAVKMGCVLAGASATLYNPAIEYSEKIGLSFQIVDDILDVTGDEKALGKPIGSDAGNLKNTYVSLYGLSNAQETAARLDKEARQCLARIPGASRFLYELTDMLTKRNH